MPTDVLCSTVEDLLHHHTSSHIANLHQARPHHPASDSALLDVKKNAAAKQQQCSQTSETTASSSNATDNSGLLKNARSASLPLKILLNDCIGDNNNCVAANTRRTNGGRFTVSDLSQKLIRSWNGMDTFLMNKFNKSPSSSTSSSSAHHHHDAAANGTNFILYARFSLSEHFLNVIEGGDRVPLSPLDRRHREERGDVSSTSSTSSSRSSSNESTSSNSNARNNNSNNNNSNQNTTTENFYLDDMDEEDDVDLDIDEDIDYEDEDDEDDEIEEESSGKTGSVDSSERTASSDAVVQFDLETEEDLQPSSARIELPPAVLSCLGQQQQPESLSDINNNDRNMKDNDEAVVEEDEAKEYDDVDEFDDDDKKQSVVSENEQSTDEAATSNNDLDQTITYEETPVSSSKEDQQLNNVVESLKNLDLEELEKDNKAVEVGEKIEYNATSSPVISSQIENDQHRSVSPISVVVDDSSNHATNFNADETLNLEDDSEVVSVDTSSGYTSNNNSMTQSSSSSSCSPGETPNTSSILSSETSSPSEPLSPSQSTATITQSTEDMNKTATTTTAAPKVVVEDSGSSRQQVNTSSASLSWSIGSSTSSMSSSAEDDAEENIFKNFMPKKSCLKKIYPNRHQLYIDTSNGGSGIFNSDNATSSPLVPATPTSPLSSSISSSPFFSSSSSSFQSPPISSSHQSEMIRSKKRVSFADVCGKDLYTIRTMSEPSNCPPKLTSKIVQFFLNREFSNQQQNGNGFSKSPYGASSKNGGVYGDGGDFFSRTRNYGYGISTSNYSNDLNQLAGTIAVYSLNFAQPSADYFKFRQRIVDSSVSLENVMLNRFQINGTIKVKNINFHKYVFVRCSFDKWSTHQDFAAQYVPSEYYSSMMSHNSHHHQQHFHQMLSSLSSSPSFSSSSSSASAYNSTPHHKEFDTFRFEFELPKNPSPSSPQSSTASNNRSGSTPNASIQFCICYRAGDSGEFWDNNEGKNYEILQYVIDIESLKPQSAQRTITSSSSSPSLSDTKSSRGASIYSNQSRPINDPITSDIYY